MSDDRLFDPFATKHVLSFVDSDQVDPQLWAAVQVDLELSTGLLTLAPARDTKLDALRAGVLALDWDEVPLPDIESPPRTSAIQSDVATTPKYNEKDSVVTEEDIWADEGVQSPRQHNIWTSWDNFLDPSHEVSPPAYISEAGPAAFDALLKEIVNDNNSDQELKYARPNVLVSALFDLGLGRTSIFFRWSSESQQFESNGDRYTVTGLSEQLLRELISLFLKHGSQCRQIERCTQSWRHGDAIHVACAGVVDDVLVAVKDAVERQRRQTLTLLQLRELLRLPFQVFDALFQMTKLFHQHKDLKSLLRELFTLAAQMTNIDVALEDILVQVLARTLHPAMQALSVRIGVEEALTPAEDQLKDAFDSVLSRKVMSQIRAVELLLGSLRRVAPQKLTQIVAVYEECQFCYQTDWDGIEQARKSAALYEQRWRSLIDNAHGLEHSTLLTSTPTTKVTQISKAMDEPFSFCPDLFKPKSMTVLSLADHAQDNLKETVSRMLSDHDTVLGHTRLPIDQALELSIIPLLSVQYRVLSYSILQTLFRDFNVLGHLQSLQRFHLMTDGPFTSQLSRALFDCEQTSGETQRTTGTAIGLRLQSRDAWPPASSELRLVLMDILSQTMSDVKDEAVLQASSFAIRDLSDDELERCRDVNSIHALDFLRLHYKPPSSILEGLITTKVLERYDRIFMYLLQLLRVKDLTQHLLRQTCVRDVRRSVQDRGDDMDPVERKFCWLIHQFTTALSNYTQNIVICTHWHTFEQKLQAIRNPINQHDYEGTLSLIDGPEHLQQLHDDTVDGISRALFLGEAQGEACQSIEEMFGAILSYASVATDGNKPVKNGGKNDNNDDDDDDDEGMRNTRRRQQLQRSYEEDFTAKLNTLLAYLRKSTTMGTRTENASNRDGNAYEVRIGNDGRSHGGTKARSSNDNNQVSMMEQLLLALDFGGYYTRPQTRTRTQTSVIV